MNIFRRKKGPASREASNNLPITTPLVWDDTSSSTSSTGGYEGGSVHSDGYLPYSFKQEADAYAHAGLEQQQQQQQQKEPGQDGSSSYFSLGPSTASTSTLIGEPQHNKAYQSVDSISPVGASPSLLHEGSGPQLPVSGLSTPVDRKLKHTSSVLGSEHLNIERGPTPKGTQGDPVKGLRDTTVAWLKNRRGQIVYDNHINSKEGFKDFLDCAYTLYKAGKSGWNATSIPEHFASAIDQTSDSNFRHELMQQLLSQPSPQDNETDLQVPGSPQSSSTHTILAAMASSQELERTSGQTVVPNIFSKDVFLDWHSKFAFYSPIQLGTKEVMPTLQLPALAGPSDKPATIEVSQERPSLVPNENPETNQPVMETPDFMSPEPNYGFFQLGKNLYQAQELSDSPLNLPRSADTSGPSRPIQQSPPMHRLDEGDDGYAIYGSGGTLQESLSRTDPTSLDLLLQDHGQAAQENTSIQVLAPYVQTAVMNGQYDVVVQLVQRNMECIDVAMETAEKNGKFALVKYLDMWKQHYRSHPQPQQNPFSAASNFGPGSSRSGTPAAGPWKPKKIDDDDFSNRNQAKGFDNFSEGFSRHLPSADQSFSKPKVTISDEDDQSHIDDDDSEEVSKLRAIYLLILMIVLSETTSSEGWDSNSTTSSSLQSFQSPADPSDYNGGGGSGGGGRPTLGFSGIRKSGSDNNNINKKKDRRDRDGGDEDDGKLPRGNRRNRGDLKSLGGRYACPYAKSEPDKHVTCWAINRQNLAGVKEHLKRFHFKGVLPPDIRAARTWYDVFDCIALNWGNRPRPSPYVDMLEIYQRALKPGETANSSGQQWTTQQQTQQQQPHARSDSMSVVVPNMFTQPQTPGFPQNFPGANFQTDALGQPIGLYPTMNDALPRRTSGAATPGSASVAGFAGVTYPMLPHEPAVTATSPNSLLPTSLTSPVSIAALAQALAAPHYEGLSPEALNSQGLVDDFQDYFQHNFGLNTAEPAPTLFTNIMDSMEVPVPVVPSNLGIMGHIPATDFSNSAQWSAASDETIHNFQQTHAPTAPSTISSSNPSGGPGQSVYQSSLTSMDMHYGVHPQNQTLSPPNMTSHSTPQSAHPVSHSSPGSVHSAREKKSLQIRRQQLNPFSTELSEGRGTFYFDDFTDFKRDFENWMIIQFTDPPFNWDEWELVHPLTNSRLSSTRAVMDELDFTFLGWRDTRAAMFLAPKQPNGFA